MQPNYPKPTLHRFFAGLADYIFHAELGIADPPLVDYVSDLLCRFIRFESLHRIRNIEGRPLDEVADMVAEAEARVGDARREVHQHIGDFTLFWVGVYPEALKRMRAPDRKDCLVDYCAQGKHAYLIAASIEPDREQAAPSELLERLSDQFELCAYGLRQVRHHWENDEPDVDLPNPLVLG